MTQQGIFELAAVLALEGDLTVVDDDAVHRQILGRMVSGDDAAPA
jgi:hypothetical protein